MPDQIEKVFRKLCRLVLKPEVVDEATTPYKLIKINVSDKNIQKQYMETNIGTAATDDLRDKSIKSDIKKSFMKECFSMVVDILTGLQERSPLKYSIVRNASAISPVNMVSKKEECVLKFQGLVDALYRKKRLNAKLADSCKQQYDEFLDVQFEHKEKFLQFNYLNDCLDYFLCVYLADEKKYENLFYVCKIVMILSRGQSSSERGFSVNKEILDNNLQERSLISQRLVYDHFTSENISFYEYVIPQVLKKSCKLANGRYKLALEDSKKATVETEK